MKNLSSPKLRFPEFIAEWFSMYLGDAIEEIAMGPFGSNLKVDMFTVKGVPIIKGGNLLKSYVTGPYSFVSEEKASSLGKSVAYPGDFIVTHRGTLGQVSLVTNKDGFVRYVTSQSQLRFRTNKNVVTDDWLIQYLRSKKGNRRMLIDAGQVGVPAISFPTSSMKSVLVVKPFLKEQQKIADFLTVVDEKITVIDQKVNLLKKYKKGVMQKIFSQQIHFKNTNGDAYTDSEEMMLGQFVKFFRGNLLSKSDIRHTGKYKCIHYGELFSVYNEVIRNIKSRTDLDTGSMSMAGDLLMPTSDVTPQGLATASLIQEDNVMLGGDINILRPRKTIDSIFLTYLINFQKKKIMRLVTGTTIRHIYSKDMAKIAYDIPTVLEEQQKIAMFLVSLDQKIDKVEMELVTVKKFKAALLQAMFV